MKTIKKTFSFLSAVLAIMIIFSLPSFAQEQKISSIETQQPNKYIAYVYNDSGSIAEKKTVSTIKEGDEWIKSKGLRGIISSEKDSKDIVGVALEGCAIDFTPKDPKDSKDKYVIRMENFKNKYDQKVLAVQKMLNYLGFGIKADGFYGKNTYAAIKKFQTYEHLQVDGVVGKYTYKYLARSPKIKKN